MTIMDKPQVYGSPSILFHWLLLITVLIALGTGLAAEHLVRSPLLLAIHKQSGISVLLCIAISMVWRVINTHPSPLVDDFFTRAISFFLRWLFYPVIAIAAGTGIAIVQLSKSSTFYAFGFYKIPKLTDAATSLSNLFSFALKEGNTLYVNMQAMHVYFTYALIGLIALHLFGSFYHHVVLGNDTVRRIFNSSDYSQ